MPYVRVTRDQRGYENTFLLHSPQPGQPPVVLYWYRSAPGVRVGRPAFDEDAIRIIEERHPDVEFDWVHLIEEASTVPPEIERPPDRGAERRRRKARREAAAEPSPAPEEAPARPDDAAVPLEEPEQELVEEARLQAQEVSTPPNPLLAQLVGREIATRLRTRYAEIAERIGDVVPDAQSRAAWLERAAALDPDRWLAPQDILHGVENAERLFDALRHDLEVFQSGATTGAGRTGGEQDANSKGPGTGSAD